MLTTIIIWAAFCVGVMIGVALVVLFSASDATATINCPDCGRSIEPKKHAAT